MTKTNDDVNALESAGYATMDQDPPWLKVAWSHLGRREMPGKANAPWLMALLVSMPAWVRAWYTDDSDQPWCGLFVGSCLTQAGCAIPKNPLSARAYLEVGTVGLAQSPSGEPRRGAVAILSRAGGGHVGFVVGSAPGFVDILAGNQQDAVNVMRFPVARVVGYRWPA
jgi:uncharacterized protein (TIGR02594 family)